MSAANDFLGAGGTPATTATSAIKCSVKSGLARHSAMTKGSFPRASNSSCRTSGCFVLLAMRSVSACNWSAVIGLCQ